MNGNCIAPNVRGFSSSPSHRHLFPLPQQRSATLCQLQQLQQLNKQVSEGRDPKWRLTTNAECTGSYLLYTCSDGMLARKHFRATENISFSNANIFIFNSHNIYHSVINE